jgi:hypothetical protein
MFHGVPKNMNSLCIRTIIRQLSIKYPKLGELGPSFAKSQDEINVKMKTIYL